MYGTVLPLTPERWPEFEDLFGKQGACYGCWCTHFRLPPALRRENDRQRNKDHMRARVEAGPPPGLLIFNDRRADGWMQIGPRADVPEWNNKGRVTAPLEDAPADDPAVWAVSCFFVRANARGNGMTHRLVEAGKTFARENGARLIEACPMTESKSSRSIGLFVGSARVFAKAGFEVVAERKAGRPLMRFLL
ncbi:GNAT family N-acetyltransferase [Nitratireductor thuwali]|uniref:GNAT family N-acetyltransferase n=1 Tax=Nitratireductor thuwali TaxID=2267699 RepID=UPI0030D60389